MADPYKQSFGDYAASFPGNPFGSLYGNVPPPRPPTIFGQTGGMAENAIQMFAPMIAEMFSKEFGAHSFLFGSDMNAGSARFAQEFMRQTNRARDEGAKQDSGQLRDIFQGLAVAIGHQPVRNEKTGRMEFIPEVQRSIDRLSGDASTMLPILASMFPDTVDRLLPRGSMAVASTSFTSAGRFVIDPATGLPTSSNAAFASEVLKPLVDQGPRSTSGLAAGRLGQTYEQLVSLGIIGSGRDLRDQVQLREGAPGVLGAAAGLDVGMSGDDARKVQASRVREKLQSYSKAISAINDIFGDAGNPNAPMGELVKALDSLTQGGMTTYDPTSLAKITRTFQSAAQTSGMSIDDLTKTSVGAAMMLERFGGHRASAAPIALYAAAAGSAFVDAGFGTPRPQGMSRSEFVQAVATNRAAFEGSPRGNLFGAISAAGINASEGSDFAALAEGVRRGDTSITLPSGQVINPITASSAEINEIARRSGMGGTLLNQLMATGNNQAELVREPGIRKLAGPTQQMEVEGQLLGALGNTIPVEKRQQFLDSLRKHVLNPDMINDNFLGKAIGQDLVLDPEKSNDIGAIMGGLAKTIGRTRDFISLERLHSPDFQKASEQRLRAFEAGGGNLADLASLNRGGFARMISTEIARWGMESTIPSWAKSGLRMIGMVDNDDIAAAMRGEDPGRGIMNMFRQFRFANEGGIGGMVGKFGIAPKKEETAAPDTVTPPFASVLGQFGVAARSPDPNDAGFAGIFNQFGVVPRAPDPNDAGFAGVFGRFGMAPRSPTAVALADLVKAAPKYNPFRDKNIVAGEEPGWLESMGDKVSRQAKQQGAGGGFPQNMTITGVLELVGVGKTQLTGQGSAKK